MGAIGISSLLGSSVVVVDSGMGSGGSSVSMSAG